MDLKNINLYKIRILRGFIFIFMIAFFDQMGGHIIRSLYFHQKSGQNQSLTYTFSKCKVDIVIFGNSRAQHHYNSQIISDSLKLTCYNAGQDGGHSILLQNALIQVITKRYSPKIIIVEFDPNDVSYDPITYDKLSILLPYYFKYKELHETILIKSPFEKIKLLSAIYPFNSNLLNIIRFNTNNKVGRKRDLNGYIPITSKHLSPDMLKKESEKESHLPIDHNILVALKDIITICQERNIKLFIINSPVFHKTNEKFNKLMSSSICVLHLIRKYKVNYFDFSSDSTFQDRFDLFADKAHLNSEGANIFSNMIVKEIKQEHCYNSMVIN